jgi:aspartate/methionine/tyrosine aminotransferase
MSFANRIANLKAEGAYAMLARAQELEAQGKEIIHMEIGQPDFDTSPEIVMAGVRALVSGQTRYNPPSGILPLRKAIAEDASVRRKTPFRWEQVVIAPGAKPLLVLPLMALLEPGDEVIYPDPGFPTYEAAIHLVGAKPVPVCLSEAQGFDLDLDSFDAKFGPKTKLVILNSPSNPTGGILSEESLNHVARAVRRYDCWILSDEIYSRLVYDREAPSISSIPGMAERTIIADGFSKTYSMTGWRLGFGIMPRELAQKVDILLTHLVGCTATFTQLAGLQGIRGSQDRVEVMRTAFKYRRDLIVKGLNEIPGIHCPMPQGAFYVFPNIAAFQMPSDQLAGYLLEEASVAVLPGSAFGSNGAQNLRLSYANSSENIQKALAHMKQALAKI